jgi:hypothetical protein
MMISFFRQLTALLLLVTVLLVPLASLAHDLESGAMKAACAGQMLQDEETHDGTGPPVACPGAGPGDYCEHEECFEDALEPPCASGLTLYPAPMQVFHLNPARALPKVYLAIFVPPESCCCSPSP